MLRRRIPGESEAVGTIYERCCALLKAMS
jgi:hypothetical protein